MSHSWRLDAPGPLVGDPRHAPSAEGLIDLRTFGRVLRRRWRTIALIFAAAILLALVALLFITPRYTATATLVVDPRQPRVLQSDVLSGIGNDMGAVESQVEIVQSTTLARRVIAQLHLDQDPEFVSKSMVSRLVDAVRGMFGGETAVPMQSILSTFAQKLQVIRRGNTYVLEIAFTSKDPEKAARISNAIADEYLAGQIKVKYDATDKASNWLSERLAVLRRQADAAGRAVAEYKATHSLVETGERRTLIEQQITDLTLQQTQAHVYTSDVEARYRQMMRVSATSAANGALPEALQSQVILSLRTQYAQAARSVAELGQSLGPMHPSYKAAAAELATIRTQIAAELARITDGLRNQLAAARGREQALERSMAVLREAAARKDEAGVRLKELEGEAETARTVLQQFLLRYKETSEQKGLQTPDARIVSPASPPLRPSYPNALILLGLAAVGGIVAGVGVAFWAERGTWSTPVVQAPPSAAAVPRLPVIGLVPELTTFDLRYRSEGAGTPPGLGEAGAMRQFSVERPLSLFGEAIRNLVAHLRLDDHAHRRVLAVLGAERGEGASTVAGNIANTLAFEGTKTLLIDMDVERAYEVGSDAAPGLMQVLGDGDPPLPLIRRLENTGLHYLPVGRVEDRAAAVRLLSAANSPLDGVLRKLRRAFDVIVVEGVSMLEAKESRRVLASADTALLVVSSAKADWRTVGEIVDGAGVTASKFLGVVLNRVDRETYETETADRFTLAV